MTTRIFRYEVPVDNRWHIIRSGPPLRAACRQLDTVEFWAVSTDDPDIPVEERHYRVYGTGHPMPNELVYVDTVVEPGGRYVWHLMADPGKVAQ